MRKLISRLGASILLVSSCCHAFSTPTISTLARQASSTNTALQLSQSNIREDEIRRKISELKREGKLNKSNNNSSNNNSSPTTPTNEDIVGVNNQKKSSVADDYAEKLSSRLGSSRKARQMGRVLGMDIQYTSSSSSSAATAATTAEKDGGKRKAKLGSLDVDEDMEEDLYEEDDEDYKVVSEALETSDQDAKNAIDMLRRNVKDDSSSDDEKEAEMDEDDMIDAVAKLLGEKGDFRSAYREMVVELEKQEEDEDESSSTAAATTTASSSSVSSIPSNTKSTSGVGGAWTPPSQSSDTTKTEDSYQPKVGTWGAFPRPRNISVAYGGGKRVGAGVKTDQSLKQQSINDTKERLRAYREKMGIEVQSEKDYADVIDEALALAKRAMQRGSYSAGVSALEKVTQYCSTKSKVGGQVFLELAMAYEAEGKTDQAIALYAALSKSPIERIKMNADKLLYGLEAIKFMRDEANLKEFSRKAAAETFIDATGFGDISKNFDKVYNTAYIDLDKGSQYYRMLTENVVRSTREARQVLLKAVDAGEVDRMKIVQALRSISRHFDEALTVEKEQEASKNVPVDYAGRPIITARSSSSTASALSTALGMDGYVLLDATQTLQNLDGEWRLQLMADKKGEGVDFFNSTLMWQTLDTSEMDYTTSNSQSGVLKFENEDRVLYREGASGGGAGAGGLFSALFSGGKSGAARKMTNVPQQVLSVDPALLVTRAIVAHQAADNVKDYFSVWRRVETGTYLKKK
eukprot:CAMPEP_0201720442 /NCGR_PEP_ID=MMETSP0593-20130828/5387_1 /ASSEMBLY_ACC=CAM_ASM_000672 /TAXON_ID=267983 /ORGANISM="Skeletonema japonicum, Strain CCMP2506" /LENGTH=747 /DNA_ID=CAMNT_0048211081 /DNA_START=95 /DNA_END=2338 /DNA_ORIENTATION=-